MGEARQRLSSALRRHWPEYLIEAGALGVFMFSAASFGVLLEYPGSPVFAALPSPFVRRMLMGLAMALTAVAIIYSPWGRRSGAHMNPATTLAFSRLGKVEPEDALFYVLAQFAGGAAGLSLALGLLGRRLADPPVHYVATLPGADGALAAFLAEVGIAFLMMLVVLLASNQPRLAGFTGLLVGLLLFSYITLEAPVSGMSLNPARTFASALPGRLWGALWVYFTAPPLGMLAAAQIYTMLRGAEKVHCAKLHHDTVQRCIFRCNYAELVRMKPPSGVPTHRRSICRRTAITTSSSSARAREAGRSSGGSPPPASAS